MDAGLLAWARAVKRRQKGARRQVPPLWFFTDAARLADPLPLIRTLPVGLCGVVLRHDGAPNRHELGREIAAICRARRLVLVVAGDARLAAALQAGLHLRGGQRPRARRPGLLTASVHNPAQLARARRAQAALLFISPVFMTKSHAGARVLGVYGWRRLARRAQPASSAALGGIDGRQVRALGPRCTAAGAIEAFFTECDGGFSMGPSAAATA